MSLPERAAYLRGLYDGLEMDSTKSKEAKLMNAIIDVLEEMAGHIAENEDSITAMADQVDDMSEAMTELEDLFLEDMDLSEDDEDEDDFVTEFEVECPNCQRILHIDDDTLAEGEVECPTCGQRFSIDMSFEENVDDAPEDTDEITF